MLYCCSKYFQTEKKYLLDTSEKHNQVLEYGICPKCSILKAVLTYKDKTGQTKIEKPKKRQAQEFINKCLSQPYYELKPVKQGSRQNMFWLYNSNGTIKDFNGEKKGDCRTEIKQDFVIMIDVSAPSNHSEGVFYEV